MRVAHFGDRLWAPGGISAYVRRVSDWQQAHGDSVIFFTAADDPDPVDAGGSRMAERVAADAALLNRAAELGADVLHTYSTIDADLARSAVPVVRTVMIHHPYCPSGSRFLSREEIPCERRFTIAGCSWGHVVDRCGSARPLTLLKNLRRTRQEQRTLTGVRMIAISDFVYRQLIVNGYDPAFIDTLHLPVRDVTPIPKREASQVRFVYAGRLAVEKGVAWLVRALAASTSGAILDIAGTGDQEIPLRALAARLGLGDRVIFHGWMNEAAVGDLLAGARASVFPSLWHEPFGLVAVEAMSHGVPVIGSRVGGIPETVRDGYNGLLVPPNDVRKLAAALDRLAGNAALANRLGAAGRRDATERFRLDGHMRVLNAIYIKALGAQYGTAVPRPPDTARL